MKNMEIKNEVEYKEALKAIEKYEEHFTLSEGEECFILVHKENNHLPLVFTDETIAKRIHENGDFGLIIKAKLFGI